MLKSIYLYVWILAFHGYMVFFLSFLVAKKNKLVNVVTILSGIGAVWIFSSLALRLGVGNNPNLWFLISEISIIVIPYFLYFMLAVAVDRTIFDSTTFFLILMGILQIVLAVGGAFFDPIFVSSADALKNSFRIDNLYDVVMNPKPLALSLVVTSTILIALCIRILYHSRKMDYRGLLLFGLVSYWVLNLFYIYSRINFPYELLAGIINGIIFMYVLRNRKILNFNKHISHMTFPLFAIVIVHIFCGLLYYREWGRLAPVKQSVMNVIFITSFMTAFVVIFFEFLFSRFFFDRGDYILKCNSEYHDGLLPRLGKIDEIADLFARTMRTTYGVVNMELYIWNEDEKCYKVHGKSEYGRKSFGEHDAIVEHTKLLDAPQSAWNVLKYVDDDESLLSEAIESRELVVFSSLNVNGNVVGFYFMGGGRVTNIDKLDRDSLSSMNKTTAMAIESSMMMHTLAHDAVTDQLTGLYDRHTTRSILLDLQKAGKPFIFLLFNIDDMKLFNLVYSIGEGDKLLSVFADTLRSQADESMTLGRVSGKTFSAFVMGTREEALRYDEKVRAAFRKANEGTIRKDITFSTGLLEVKENDERNEDQLLDDVKCAEVQAKRQGKNRLFIFRDYMAENPVEFDPGFRIGTVDAISKALDLRDHFTYDHSDNVAIYARGIAEAIGLDPMTIQVIYEAGLVHDIGKISIPDSVLLNTGKLTDEEYEIMKTHVERGKEVIESLPHGFLMVPIAMTHHERWDGKGYPHGLKGEEIPIGGRCLAIADTFDAMTSRRIYKKARSVDDALDEILRVSGTQLDPHLGPLFVKLVREGRIIPHPAV